MRRLNTSEATPAAVTRRGLSLGWRSLPIALALLDGALVYAAFAVSYWIRYTLKLGPQIQASVAFSAYQSLAVLLVSVMLLVLAVKGAYRVRMGTDIVDDITRTVSAATITIGIVVVITTMIQKDVYSRGVIVYLWVSVIVLVALGRTGYRAVQGFFHRRGWGISRVLVVGATHAGMMAMQSMMSRPDLGYQLAGFVYHRTAGQLRDFGRFRALGTVADIPALVESNVIDEIIIALPAAEHEEVWPILALCEKHGMAMKLIPDLFEMSLSRVEVDDIAGIPLLDVREKPLRRVARDVKRLSDIALALVGLILTAPLVGLLMLLIRLESAGPALLRQDRVGAGGRRFTCFKLRTMGHDAEDARATLSALNETSGPLFKIKEDPRRTRLGRRIRSWSLDELPQLINVLRGEMSVVGPRPPLPGEVEMYETWHMRRLEVKPGLTGIWQVSGRSDLPFDEMILMDIFYVDNWSLALDVRILLRTVIPVLGRHGAY
ncbi:MAG: sugar transferase [Chloroflexota bacterium]